MIQIKNLAKNYGNKKVLKNVNMELQKGSINALIGLNGAGKSTLFEIICGVIKSNGGFVLLDGLDISNSSNIKKIKNMLGYMPQTYRLFPDLTVKENLKYLSIAYNIKNKEERILEVLKRTNLLDKQNFLAESLSGGYKQLLSLAGAIINYPNILILDEPSVAMDPVFRNMFWEIITKLSKEDGITVLYSTHYQEEIEFADNVMLLSDGEIKWNYKIDEYKKIRDLNSYENLWLNEVNKDE